jgi:hypothetical protein
MLQESPGYCGGGMHNEVAVGRVIEGASGSCLRGSTIRRKCGTIVGIRSAAAVYDE